MVRIIAIAFDTARTALKENGIKVSDDVIAADIARGAVSGLYDAEELAKSVAQAYQNASIRHPQITEARPAPVPPNTPDSTSATEVAVWAPATASRRGV